MYLWLEPFWVVWKAGDIPPLVGRQPLGNMGHLTRKLVSEPEKREEPAG